MSLQVKNTHPETEEIRKKQTKMSETAEAADYCNKYQDKCEVATKSAKTLMRNQ